ncbi:MAG TPA: hypothetical protein VFC03_03835 [Acidimicrobiales bacterium]|nr:hypothetical protein [Acidimicrobiales bacterium]
MRTRTYTWDDTEFDSDHGYRYEDYHGDDGADDPKTPTALACLPKEELCIFLFDQRRFVKHKSHACLLVANVPNIMKDLR